MDPLATLGVGLAGTFVGALLGYFSQMLQSRAAHKRQLELNQQAHQQQMERDERAHLCKQEDERRERLRSRYMELLRAAKRYEAVPSELRARPKGENEIERTRRIDTYLQTVRKDFQDTSLALQLEDPHDQEILPLLGAIEMVTFRYIEKKEEQAQARQDVPAAELIELTNQMTEYFNMLVKQLAERLAITRSQPSNPAAGA